ncbi:GNAT family N-acetyltransferase [Mycetocola spongiae]|uniref:GNAT family N-acetyltransferase n=1 Tax=Mycetocola spongiae TaxID=2859226 RepID=UPI001CF4AC9C|nr:GNAT family N-acetyltransferase [Mycetocola spongiae]
MNSPPIRIVLNPDPARHPELVPLWRAAVEATHAFLTPADIAGYEGRLLRDYFPQVTLAVAQRGEQILGFSGTHAGNLEMLFIDPAWHGRGVGSALLAEARGRFPALTVDVNEENPAAVGFYLARGFIRIGRSATDGEGRPFPLLHLATALPE